jgi:hypothetical protein
MTANNNDDPPLLASWLMFRRHVLHQEAEYEADEAMMTFYGGAGTILNLLRSAHEQGGNQEFSFAFSVLTRELEAFQGQMRDFAAKGTMQ